jgi:tetratricopeptide (TPR) repeat protein
MEGAVYDVHVGRTTGRGPNRARRVLIRPAIRPIDDLSGAPLLTARTDSRYYEPLALCLPLLNGPSGKGCMTSRNAGWVGQVVALVMLLGSSGLARAQDAPPPKLTEAQKRETRERYEKATKLYNLGKFTEAIVEYQAAYLVSADPVMLYNIAQCHRNNSQPEEAIRFYKNFLRNSPNTPNRAQVEERIGEMEKLAEEKRKQAAAPPPPVQTAPPVETQTPTGPTAPSPVTPPEVTAPPLGTGPDATVQQSIPESPPPPRSRVLPMSLMIGGGAFVVTSLVCGAVAGSKAKQVEEKARSGARFDESVKQLENTGKKASALAVLTGLVGLAAGATGAYLWFRSDPGPEAAAATVFPLAGPGLAGAGLHFDF